MARAFGAFPEFRHPFEATPIHPEGSTTVLYQGKAITLSDTGNGNGLLIRPEDLSRVNGFELKAEGACFKDMDSDQSGEPTATGHRGFYFHFLDMRAHSSIRESPLPV